MVYMVTRMITMLVIAHTIDTGYSIIPSRFYPWKKQTLYNAGLIDISEYGKVSGVLPRFKGFVD